MVWRAAKEEAPFPKNYCKPPVVAVLTVVTVLSIVRGGAKDVNMVSGLVTITGIIDKTISADFVGLHDNGLHVA